MAELTRRAFLKITGYGGAGAIATGLGVKAAQTLIPYVIPPETTRPGVWTLYATTCRECPAGCGMHVRHRDGRVVKAEGNPYHSINNGKLCPRGQASVQGLYDPNRVRQPLIRTGGTLAKTDWQHALTDLADKIGHADRVVLISDVQTGSLAEVMEQFAAAWPNSRLLLHEPLHCEALKWAHKVAFGQAIIPQYRLDEAQLVLSFGVDFLETWVSNVQWSRQFASVRDYHDGRLGRFVYFGPRLSMTAANADTFVQMAPGAEAWAALAILQSMLDQGLVKNDTDRLRSACLAMGGPAALGQSGLDGPAVAELARAFAQQPSVALAGPAGTQSPAARQGALAAALLNYAGGWIGKTVYFNTSHALSRADDPKEVRRVLDSLDGRDVVIVHNTDLLHNMPDAAAKLAKAMGVAYLGTLNDATAAAATWVLPIDSPLESWGEYEPWTGWHGLIQPTMQRIYDTRNAGDILLATAELADRPLRPAGADQPVDTLDAWLRQRWEQLRTRLRGSFAAEHFWSNSLRGGGQFEFQLFVNRQREGGHLEPILAGQGVQLVLSDVQQILAPLATSQPGPAAQADLWVAPSINLYDGRLGGRGWMQEIPDPVSCICWGSWIEIHPDKAAALGVADGDVLEIKTSSGSVEAPVRVTLDIQAGAVGIQLGQGRTIAGQTVGANAFALLSGAGAAGMFGRVALRKTGKKASPLFQDHTQQQHGRELLRWADLDDLRAGKVKPPDDFCLPLPEAYHASKDVFRTDQPNSPSRYPHHRWAMAIDLQRCIGCGACAAACYAENNVAVIGPGEVNRSRVMAWLRVIPYRREQDERRVGFLPMLCQHCDTAPCESVCPVYASVHNEEGLNAQVYNRCIGTRYCSNNCPYKVRRFNWFDNRFAKPLDWQLNPEVTVRERGVMEKCTFCIQRIREVEYRARREKRPIRDGEVQPACVQTCPTGALVFGDLRDETSAISKLFGGRDGLSGEPRRYQLLQELNAKPAIIYLRRIIRRGGS